ncbi:hypothetical protein JTE90_001618 [Oedothorax gibbosus]|uniref:Ribosomal protein S18 n=1 Tax=Oedothorax gibbosus TaxID=931172 RepID=A0AAV6VP90_9ARAC|nr:hypothetical protein JTE90_001618 [Oedothorax gibbosus]
MGIKKSPTLLQGGLKLRSSSNRRRLWIAEHPHSPYRTHTALPQQSRYRFSFVKIDKNSQKEIQAKDNQELSFCPNPPFPAIEKRRMGERNKNTIEQIREANLRISHITL